jgi:hypothetical protein
MRLLAVAVIAGLPTAAAAVSVQKAPLTERPIAASSEQCPRTTSYHAWHRDQPVTPQKLNQLPHANAYAAVLRKVRGCEVPVIVKHGISNR